ncbi:MAG: 2-hydroxychromene-2-carboxylate isomerase [Alphaproteobacteria bacterium]|nr:2-hydroxychromene-2-carboxylate isomerase [Alphaproteobacteria bacterium]
MAQAIEFYYDFSSPYGYAAIGGIEALAKRHGRGLIWKPFLLGAAFKVTGGQPLTTLSPIKTAYFAKDFARSARRYGLPFKMPSTFPLPTIPTARGHYWLESAKGADAAIAYSKASYRAFFGDDKDISRPETCADIAAGLGHDRAAFLAGINEQPVKDRLKAVTEEAIARGVFGSPFFIVDGEAFWGADRLDMIDEWLKRGGW